jgi:pimeloyl-ACP methyl ester carboxylesterase
VIFLYRTVGKADRHEGALSMRRFASLILIAMLSVAAAFAASAGPPSHDFFTTKDGVKIHYMQSGTSGSYVVLIHGYTGSAEGNWYRNGVAEKLSENHRVVAIDCRNHGRSDKPTPGGPGKAEDVIELMDHLKIAKAHIHGYSMGGGITGSLLATNPQRFITASFGGSGVPETDEELRKRAAAMDKEGVDPQEAEASKNLRIRNAMDNGKTKEEAEKLASQPPAPRPAAARPAAGAPARPPLDLTKVTIPVLAINGELDRPHAKTARMYRELNNFQNIVLPGKSHLTAIAAPYIPKEYPEGLARFINANDVK